MSSHHISRTPSLNPASSLFRRGSTGDTGLPSLGHLSGFCRNPRFHSTRSLLAGGE